jgi:hypothetical protein
MNKKTKMYVGVALVAAAAYYFWNKSQADKTAPATTDKKSFVNAAGTCKIRDGRKTYYGYNDGYGYCQTPQGTFRSQY